MKFQALGVNDTLTELLKTQGIKMPTPIQEIAIPAAFKGKDLIGRSQTGTGKTLAYLLPVVQRVDTKKSMTQVLVMTPTRELAKQVFDVLRPLAIQLGVDATDIIGGRTIENQLQKLKRDPHIIIGTPGRLLDHIRRKSLDLSNVATVILDEADQMLANGFREDIEALIDETPKKRQLLMFSATMPDEAKRLARKYMHHPSYLDVAEKVAASTVEQRVYDTTMPHKFKLLVRHLTEMNPYMAVVFCNTRDGAHELAGKLQEETDFVAREIRSFVSLKKQESKSWWLPTSRPAVLTSKVSPTYLTTIFLEIWNTTCIALAAPDGLAPKVWLSPTPPQKMDCCFVGWKNLSKKPSPAMTKKAT